MILSILFFLPPVLALVTPVHRRSSATISIPVSSRFKSESLVGANTAEADRARFRRLIAKANGTTSGSESEASITDRLVDFTVSVGVGSPPTFYNLIVDSGSSNTWVGANTSNPYVPTSTSFNTTIPVGIDYGSGFFRGFEFFDIVTIGDFTFNQSIGVATSSSGFQGFDGVLGIGATEMAGMTLNLNDTTNPITDTVVDSMHDQGLIQEKLVSLFLEPIFNNGSLPSAGDSLDFGAIDLTKVVGPITYTNITQSFPENQFWGIDASMKLFGQQEPFLNLTAGIVDSGTTSMLLATDAYQKYQETIGASLDNTTGLLKLSKEQFQNLPSLFISINGTDFEMTPDAQALPLSFTNVIDPDSVFLCIADLGNFQFGFVLGSMVLRRFISIYDGDNHRVGLANTPFTFSIVNVP